MSDARKKAEEAVNGISAAIEETIEVRLLVPLRALLAEEPEAANFIRCAVPRGECCHQRIPAVLPLEAPECNDGDDCCRYCGRGLQPCGACKTPPPADAATKDDIRALIGEGFHTMLRKGIDGHGSGELHRYICELGDGDWVEMLDYWVVDPLMAELDRLRAPIPPPPADAATEAVREAAERLKAHISLSATKAALRHAARELQYVLDSNPCDQYDIHQTVEGKACVALAEGLLGPMQDWPDEENASAILSALAARRGDV